MKPTLSKLENVEQPDAEAGSSATTCYRLLDCDDKIRGTDEFLEDDATHWSRIDWDHSWTIGSYWHSALKPMRRISGDNSPVRPQTPA